jgi:membrane protease YdiL (CAAX protease family)
MTRIADAQELPARSHTGRFDVAFPGFVSDRLPFSNALILTAIAFSFWHLPNFILLPPGYVVFQLGYTFLFILGPGLTRQWTGSIWPAVVMHSAGNFIAWSLH